MFTVLPSSIKLFNLLEKPIKLVEHDFHFVSQCRLLLIIFSSFMCLEKISITFQGLMRTGLPWASLTILLPLLVERIDIFSLPVLRNELSHLPSKNKSGLSIFPASLSTCECKLLGFTDCCTSNLSIYQSLPHSNFLSRLRNLGFLNAGFARKGRGKRAFVYLGLFLLYHGLCFI